MHFVILIYIAIATSGPRIGLPNVVGERHVYVRNLDEDIVFKIYRR